MITDYNEQPYQLQVVNFLFTIQYPFQNRTQDTRFKNFNISARHNNSIKRSLKNIKTEFSSPRLRVKSVKNDPVEESLQITEKFIKKKFVTERKGEAQMPKKIIKIIQEDQLSLVPPEIKEAVLQLVQFSKKQIFENDSLKQEIQRKEFQIQYLIHGMNHKDEAFKSLSHENLKLKEIILQLQKELQDANRIRNRIELKVFDIKNSPNSTKDRLRKTFHEQQKSSSPELINQLKQIQNFSSSSSSEASESAKEKEELPKISIFEGHNTNKFTAIVEAINMKNMLRRSRFFQSFNNQ